MKILGAWVVLSAVVVASVGCGSDDKGGIDWSAGRGGEGCRDWQQAFCEFQARCGGVSLSQCASDIQALLCTSDSDAAACAGSIPASGCTAIPAGCMHTALADRAWATQTCNEYASAMCTHNVSCGAAADMASCLTEAQAALPCDRAIGIKTNYDQCLKKINEAACSATYPAECESLILLADAAATTG